MDGRIRFVYAKCGRRYFCIRIKKFADTKISGRSREGKNDATYDLGLDTIESNSFPH